MPRKLLIFLFLGFFIRLLLVPQPGFEADIAFWKSWSLAATDKGVVWLTENTNYNYPSGFTLVLWIIGKIYQVFANPHNFNQYWDANNYLYLLLSKLPSILADLAIAVIIFVFVSQPKSLNLPEKSKNLASALAGLYLLHPVVLFDGAWWGQVDSFGAVFAFLCLFFLAKKRPILASVALISGFLLKMQNLIFLPLVFLFIARSYPWKTLVKSLAAAVIAFLALSFPFLLANKLDRVYSLIYQNSDWFPWLSLRAFNPWWLVSRLNWQASDKVLTLGVLNAKSLSLVVFSAVYFLIIGLILFKPKVENLLLSMIASGLAFFLLPTQSHERYFFPALALSILSLPIFFQNSKFRKLIWGAFGIFSFSGLVNLNYSLTANYPDNGLGLLGVFNLNFFQVFFSLFNTGILILILFWFIKRLPLYWPLGSLLVILGGFIVPNWQYLFTKQISLTKIVPVASQQDFGSLQINQSLNSAAGPKSWAFPSINYYFYRRALATHANSKISFDLGGKFKEFKTDIGIDSDAGAKASVEFEVYADNQLLAGPIKMTKFDLPKRLAVPIKGVKTLTLVARDAGDGITDDHADWLEPVLSR